MIADSEWRALHMALLAGEREAPERVIDRFYHPVCATLHRKHARLPRELIDDAVVDAIIAYLTRPQTFDPARSALLTFLTSVADNKLRSLLRERERRGRREVLVGGVSDMEELGLLPSTGTSVEQYWLEQTTHEVASALYAVVLATFPDPLDRRLFGRICDGRTETRVWAVELHISHLADREQQRIVKRHRDRILRRLRSRRGQFQRLYDGS